MIGRKSSDIKVGVVAALAIRSRSNNETTDMTKTASGRVTGLRGTTDFLEGRKMSLKHTPIAEEEVVNFRRSSVLAVRAYEKIAVCS